MKTLSSNLWVKGKPLLPSSSDCAKLIRVKIPADEVHWRGTSHGTGTLSNPHPVASEQLPTTYRDLTRPRHPFATGTDTCTTHVWFFRIQTYRFYPTLLQSRWSGFLKHFLICIPVGVWGEGGAFTFNLDPLVTLVHDTIHRQPLTKHAKIKEKLDKMKWEGKIYRKSEPKAWCSDMNIQQAKDEFRICLDPSNTIKKAVRGPRHPIHIFGVRFHVQCYMTFDASKPRNFGHWLNYTRPGFWLRRFFIIL